MVRAYWWRVFSRSWNQSLRTLGLDSRGRIVTAFLTFLITIAVLLFWGSQDAASDAALERSVIWALALLAFPAVYVWNFVRAPAEIDQQNRRNINNLVGVTSKLTVQLAKKETDRIKILTLSVFRENGQKLVSEKISVEEYSRWSLDVETWKTVGVACLATDFSHQDSVLFHTIQYRPIPYGYRVSADHNGDLNALTARIQMLNNVIDRYQDQWSPITEEERLIANSRLAVFEAHIATFDSVKTPAPKDRLGDPHG